VANSPGMQAHTVARHDGDISDLPNEYLQDVYFAEARKLRIFAHLRPQRNRPRHRLTFDPAFSSLTGTSSDMYLGSLIARRRNHLGKVSTPRVNSLCLRHASSMVDEAQHR